MSAQLEAQRDALLESLKRMASIIDKMGAITRPDPWRVLKCEEALTQARAVIAAVEEQKTTDLRETAHGITEPAHA